MLAHDHADSSSLFLDHVELLSIFIVPSVLCCGGKNLEQSPVRSDVISDTVDI